MKSNPVTKNPFSDSSPIYKFFDSKLIFKKKGLVAREYMPSLRNPYPISNGRPRRNGRSRFVWTLERHEQFLEVVGQLGGLENAKEEDVLDNMKKTVLLGEEEEKYNCLRYYDVVRYLTWYKYLFRIRPRKIPVPILDPDPSSYDFAKLTRFSFREIELPVRSPKPNPNPDPSSVSITKLTDSFEELSVTEVVDF